MADVVYGQEIQNEKQWQILEFLLTLLYASVSLDGEAQEIHVEDDQATSPVLVLTDLCYNQQNATSEEQGIVTKFTSTPRISASAVFQVFLRFIQGRFWFNTVQSSYYNTITDRIIL
jgi:hypothetical protein